MQGRKDDHTKPRYDLLPLSECVEPIVSVLTFGAEKYEDHNWQRVPQARNRYYAALQRHLAAWQAGQFADPESGLSHLAHAGCCLMFLLWLEQHPQTTQEEPK